MTALAVALVVIIGVPLLVASLVSGRKQRMRRASRTLDNEIFRRDDEREEED